VDQENIMIWIMSLKFVDQLNPLIFFVGLFHDIVHVQVDEGINDDVQNYEFKNNSKGFGY